MTVDSIKILHLLRLQVQKALGWQPTNGCPLHISDLAVASKGCSRWAHQRRAGSKFDPVSNNASYAGYGCDLARIQNWNIVARGLRRNCYISAGISIGQIKWELRAIYLFLAPRP